MSASSANALADVWSAAGLPQAMTADVAFEGPARVLPSSFAVDAAAQASIAAAALAAEHVSRLRGAPAQTISIDAQAAAAECSAWFSIDGKTPPIWDKFSGLYPCGADVGAPGHVRIHANFAHHRDGALALLGAPTDGSAEKTDVANALRAWRAEDFEQAAGDRKLVVSALRSFAQWDAHPHAAFLRAADLVAIEKIGEAAPRALPARAEKPLAGVRVIELTRILAGPAAGRTLAAYGADVMLVNSPHLPNISSIMETSRGKLSAQVDLQTEDGKAALRRLVRDAHVFVQGYRPGGLAALGFSDERLADLRPGVVCVSLDAYGYAGPWAGKRGFDSLVQTATGFNHAEGEAAGGEPRALPVQILDYATGFLMAFGASVALARQMQEGGSWRVRVSLARTGLWLRSLGRIDDGFALEPPDLRNLARVYKSGYGELVAFPHSARYSRASTDWPRPSVPPGAHAPQWPD
ncbi:MAG: CoA transferase [Hyphomicrobiales bacterium]|nr:CoA transferase [Hyphomicrobiales bacterium]